MRHLNQGLSLFTCLALLCASARAAEPDDPLATGRFAWKSSAPLVAPVDRPTDECRSVKDPTVVQFDGRWHLFVTIRSKVRTHQIEYSSFADWADADKAERHVLELLPGYFCAPQVFWFTPHKKWYLVYQIGNPGKQPGLLPAFSTTESIGRPDSWTAPKPLYTAPPKIARWIDFWVVCDEAKAYLFATSNDGKMWRSSTALADFPHGWSQPEICLQGDIFEASHTYRLKGRSDFLTVIEAQKGSRRYYKAYLTEKLDGVWKPLAATWEMPFAGRENVHFAGERWSDSISHGELTRNGHDERMEVDPATWKFLYQGVLDKDMAGKPYGEIPWRLGLLEPVK